MSRKESGIFLAFTVFIGLLATGTVIAMLNELTDPGMPISLLNRTFMYGMWGLCMFFSFASPCMMALLLSFLHFNAIICANLRIMSSDMQTGSVPMSVIARSGWTIVDSFKAFEKAFSGFICVEIVLSIWNVTVGLFFTIGLVSGYVQQDHYLSIIPLTAAFQFCTSSFCIMKLHLLFGSGQKLVNVTKNFRERLDQRFSDEIHRLSKNEVSRIESLLWTLRTQSPIRPYDLFDLRFSSGLTTTGVLITYVVIMLQFKFGERA